MPTRSPLAGVDRAHADRLRTRRLLARLAHTVGPPGPGSAASRFGDCLWLRHLQTSRGVSAGREISMVAACLLWKPPHRLLPKPKGRLYAWDQTRRHPEVILVEGLFDYAALVA